MLDISESYVAVGVLRGYCEAEPFRGEDSSLSTMQMVPSLSSWIGVGSVIKSTLHEDIRVCNSVSRRCFQIISRAHVDAATYSASVDDSETHFCRAENHAIGPPRISKNPEVDTACSACLPAQSLLEGVE